MSNKTVGFVYLGKGLIRRYLQQKYLNALKRAGADVRVLRWTGDQSRVEEFVRDCDGFIFPGGDDINPALYGEKKQAWCGEVCDERDDFELKLLMCAAKSQKPILGVCRGAQLINAAFGGTLYQDIVHDTQNADIKHWDIKNRAKRVHTVSATDGSLLKEIIGSGEFKVNTMHHQAINRIADGFRAVAVAPDGITEAIEKSGEKFFLAVQWHPEFLAPRFADQFNIFQSFVDSL
ncbi:MAG: type 1 glutamine amidotransferase [Oscillospiraceae bacterium]